MTAGFVLMLVETLESKRAIDIYMYTFGGLGSISDDPWSQPRMYDMVALANMKLHRRCNLQPLHIKACSARLRIIPADDDYITTKHYISVFLLSNKEILSKEPSATSEYFFLFFSQVLTWRFGERL